MHTSSDSRGPSLWTASKENAQQAGTMAQQQAHTPYHAGGLFASTAGAGLQERLTAESAAAATRTKQYTAALQTLANQGGQTGTSANTIQQAINSGMQNIGGKLYNAAGNLIGDVAEVFGNSVSDLWNSLTNAYPAGNNPDEVVTNIGTDIVNEIGDIISGGGDAIKKAWNSIFGP